MRLFRSILPFIAVLCQTLCFSQSKTLVISGEALLNSQDNEASIVPLTQSNSSFIGLTAYTFDKRQQHSLEYSFQENGIWSAWLSFDQFVENSPEDRTSFEAKPLSPHTTALKFRSSNLLSSPLVVRIFDPSNISNLSYELNDSKAGSCNCDLPAYCGRECWCPNGTCPKNTQPSYTAPTHIIIHHSAGFNSSSNYKEVVAYYWDFHVNTNGWSDISYNWLIDPNGVLYEGRGAKITGAHFSCMNSQTMGVCLIGDFTQTAPQEAALNTLVNLLAWESCADGLNPTDTTFHQSSQLALPVISSHRDGNSSPASNSCASGTVCPGDFMYQRLNDVRNNVAAKNCLATGIADNLSGISTVSILANPSGTLELVGVPNNYSVAIYNVVGELIVAPIQLQNQTIIPISELPSGYYIVQVIIGSTSKRFVWIKSAE